MDEEQHGQQTLDQVGVRGASKAPLVPVFRFPGGKSWLCRHLRPFLPPVIRHYVDPFVGGGAVFLHVLFLLDSGALRLAPGGTLIINDSNVAIIACYRALQCAPKGLAHLLKLHVDAHNARTVDGRRAYYAEVRDAFNASKRLSLGDTSNEFFEQCARFLYLSRSSFRGLYRENRRGEYNAPVGESKKLDVSLDAFVAVSNALRRYHVIYSAVSAQQFFRTSLPLGDLGPQDVVLVDPPYESLGARGFTEYGKQVWSDLDFIWLRRTCNDLRARGVRTFVCNNRVPRIVDLFERPSAPWYKVAAVTQRSGMQSGHGGREEVVYCNIAPHKEETNAHDESAPM